MSGWTCNFTNDPNLGVLNDLYLDSNGNIAYLTDSEEDQETEIIETCYHAVQLTLGDYDFDTSIGIPYNDYLSSDSPIGNQLKLSLTTALLNVNGVVSVDSIAMSLDPNTRLLAITIIVNLTNNNQKTITTLI